VRCSSTADNCPFDVLCFRSSHAVTMVSQYPYRHVQVVLRLYSSPSEGAPALRLKIMQS
jgi:hypothetical protein